MPVTTIYQNQIVENICENCDCGSNVIMRACCDHSITKVVYYTGVEGLLVPGSGFIGNDDLCYVYSGESSLNSYDYLLTNVYQNICSFELCGCEDVVYYYQINYSGCCDGSTGVETVIIPSDQLPLQLNVSTYNNGSGCRVITSFTELTGATYNPGIINDIYEGCDECINQSPCEIDDCQQEIVILMDATTSISSSDWELAKEGVINIATSLESNMDNDEVRIGVIQWSDCGSSVIQQLTSNYDTLVSNVQSTTNQEVSQN